MSGLERLEAEPWLFDLLGTLREFERSTPDKPRIGDSAVLGEEVVRLGQDPFLEFPAANISGVEKASDGTPVINTRFLGFFGPQGALPLNITIEASEWSRRRDVSYARFVDIIGTRFLQLFFRAWADSRPIAQFDRPEADRFFAYIGSLAGFGSPASRNRDCVPDIAKLSYASLAGSKVKSASRLQRLVRGVLGIEIEIEEHVGSWLLFESGDRTRLGVGGSTLGGDIFVGDKLYSINDKIRLALKTKDIAQYREFLPSGDRAAQLADLVFFYIGHRQDFDVELALPAREAPPIRLGQSGEIGWTSWLAPDRNAPADAWRRDARFRPKPGARPAAPAVKARSKGRVS